MRKVLLVLKIVICLCTIGAVGATVHFVTSFQKELTPEVPAKVIAEKLQSANAIDLQPGEKVFARAHELLVSGNLKEGREKLLDVINYHPGTRSGEEARRIIGEMNMDEELSPKNMANKSFYTVKGGDSFIAIASRSETSLDLLMYLNRLSNLRSLHPGDEFVVMPLNYQIVIEPDRRMIGVWKDGDFIKEYPILKIESDRRLTSGTSRIAEKTGYLNGRSYPPSRTQYRFAEKVLSLDKLSLQLREITDEESAGEALFFSPPDMEELAMILRVGNEVTIRTRSK